VVSPKQLKPVEQGAFFHRKVAKSGGSRYIAVGKILPDGWHIVRVKVLKLVDRTCVLEITKLD